MMRRFTILLVAVMTAVSLAACSNGQSGSDLESQIPPESSVNDVNALESAGDEIEPTAEDAELEDISAENTDLASVAGSSNILIAYFTRSDNVDREPDVDAVTRATFNVQSDGIYGNTELLARYIHDVTDGDLFSIKTAVPYPYDVDETIASIYENDPRVELSTHIDNMDQYDTVFIGYPNFNGTIPIPVFSFLEEHDFTGKTIIPYSTHRGSRFGSSISDLEAMLPNSTILEGYTVDGDSAYAAQDEVTAWLQDIGFID